MHSFQRFVHLLGRVALVVFTLVLLAGAVFRLTGEIHVIVPSGNSMEPGIVAGDLVIVRDRDRYVEGDAVAYRSEELGTVLHRIVDVELTFNGPRYVLQGDNNDFLDSERPSEPDILGEAIIHLPGGARLLGLLPLVVAGSVAVWWVRSSRSGRSDSFDARSLDDRVDLRRVVGTSAAFVFFGVSVLAAFSSPIEPLERTIFHSSSMAFDWSADTDATLVYPDGRIRTGDPAFLNVADSLDITLGVVFDNGIEDLGGDIQLIAIASDPSGWTFERELSDIRPITTTFQTISGELYLGELWQDLRRVAASTSYDPGRYDLTITARGEMTGALGGHEISQPMDHGVDFFLDGVVLRPKPDQATAADRGGLVTVEDARERLLGVGPLALPVAWLRLLAPLALAGAIVLAWWPRRELTSQELINRRFGDHVLDVHEQALPIDGPVVQVERFEDMLRLAQIEGAPILHLSENGRHEWATSAMGVWYRYLLLPAAVAATTAQTGQLNEDGTEHDNVPIVVANADARTED